MLFCDFAWFTVNPRITFSTTIETLHDATLTTERGESGCQRSVPASAHTVDNLLPL